MHNRLLYTITIWALSLILISCDENNNFVLFSVSQDAELGKQVSQEIESDPNTVFLSEQEYPEAYAYLNAMRDEILNSGKVTYKDEFVWQLKIIRDDDVLNAFATPGGYIYVYTGLIKFLDKADDLAGVLGHEIAHADLRHTSRNLQKQYGVQVLINILLGSNQGGITQIAGDIAGAATSLRFSRDFETEADAESVEYLGATQYACNGASFFFQKLSDSGQAGGTPEFLSTHPSPDNRIEAINQRANDLGCSTQPATDARYEQFKNSLP